MASGLASRFWTRMFGTVERQEWLDRIGDPLEHSVRKTFKAGGKVGQKAADFLHGTWFGHPFHPALTDIPIGAWTAVLVLDTVDDATPRTHGYRQAAADAVLVGIVGAVASAITGLTDYQHLEPRQRRIGLVHAALNSGALALMTSSFLARRRGYSNHGKWRARLGWTLMALAASYGGHLVYKQRVGVTKADERERPRDFVPVLAVNDLRDDQPRRVLADGVRVVLVRHADRIYALGEECSHMGGPLAEGRITGDSIECPWHGSRFALEGGQVKQGPATEMQPCFEVRIRDGQIELRRAERVPGLAPPATATAGGGLPAARI